MSHRGGVCRPLGMNIAIVGGTGTLGRQVVSQLRAQGHGVRVLSRNAPEYRVDLTTGEGLDKALAGCDVVVDASNNASRRAAATLVDGTRRLLAAGQEAGVAHHICVSVVGCDLVPMAYFKVKAEQEDVVARGTTPATIVRATQFHEYVAAMMGAAARYGVAPVPPAVLQPVASAEVAAVVAEAAADGPRRGRVEIAGPEVTSVTDLARTWRRAAGRRAVLVPLPLPGALGRALRAGALTAAAPDIRGGQTFAEWAQAQGGMAR
ncbi:MAG TPA: NmrA family NAD(P)-binding protein [Trebonia sp.]